MRRKYDFSEPDIPNFNKLSGRNSHMVIGQRAGDAGHVVRGAGDVIKLPRGQQLVLGEIKSVYVTVVGSTCIQRC